MNNPSIDKNDVANGIMVVVRVPLELEVLIIRDSQS
jgi:hypothetical protein